MQPSAGFATAPRADAGQFPSIGLLGPVRSSSFDAKRHKDSGGESENDNHSIGFQPMDSREALRREVPAPAKSSCPKIVLSRNGPVLKSSCPCRWAGSPRAHHRPIPSSRQELSQSRDTSLYSRPGTLHCIRPKCRAVKTLRHPADKALGDNAVSPPSPRNKGCLLDRRENSLQD